MASKIGKVLPDPLPPTASVPACGAHFFDAGPQASWRMARRGIIPTVKTGSRNMRALPRVLAERLSHDPDA